MSKIKLIVEAELSNLDKAIDYAEEYSKNRDYQFHDPSIIENLKKIHSGQQSAYREFMRVAWGKAIRINSEKKGELVYRLSQSAAIIPGINIATPLSPVGRLVNTARPGDIDESSVLGEYSIEDVWYFERYIDNEYLENIKNFKKMLSQGKNEFTIKNLIEWLSKKLTTQTSGMEEKYTDINTVSPWDRVIFDENEDELVIPFSKEDSEESKSISLPTQFFINLTSSQYDSAHHGPFGLVYVFGVAGSGKTSVALGRSKSLAQLGQLPKDDHRYNQYFPEETQIGIVRTNELIYYLKDTCNMLSLHRLPVIEYREIYEELKAHWNIEVFKDNRPKFMLAQDSETFDIETKHDWFNFISTAMLEIFSQKILKAIKSFSGRVSPIDGDIFEKIHEILISDIRHVILKKKLFSYLAEIENALNKSIEKIFSQIVWIGLYEKGNMFWYSDKHHNIADHLFNSGKILCLLKSGDDLQIIIPEIKKDNWKKWIPESAKYNSQNGDNIPNYIKVDTSNGKCKKIMLLTMTNKNIVQHLSNGAIRFYDGIDHRTQSIKTKNEIYIAHMPRIVTSNMHIEGSEKKTRSWRSKVRARVLNNFRKYFAQLIPAELFIEAIKSITDKDNEKYSSLLKSKKKQVASNKLSEHDIDLLIAFISSITRGMNKESILTNNHLKPTPYRSSVFIDEVQDFSEIQILSLSLLSDPKYNSVTAVGDPAQCLYKVATELNASFPEKMWKNALKQELNENIRQQHVPTINAMGLNFRNKYIKDINVNISRYEKNNSISLFHRTSRIDQLRITYKIISLITRKETVVIVVPSVERAEEAIKTLKPHLREMQHRECGYATTIDLSKKYIAHVTTPKNIKGLEFDHLISLYLEEYDLYNSIDKNSLYVMMTRPKKELSLIGNFERIRDDFSLFLKQFADIK